MCDSVRINTVCFLVYVLTSKERKRGVLHHVTACWMPCHMHIDWFDSAPCAGSRFSTPHTWLNVTYRHPWGPQKAITSNTKLRISRSDRRTLQRGVACYARGSTFRPKWFTNDLAPFQPKMVGLSFFSCNTFYCKVGQWDCSVGQHFLFCLQNQFFGGLAKSIALAQVTTLRNTMRHLYP